MAACRENYCQKCKKKQLNIADKRDHLESDEHENKKKFWYCGACGTDIKRNSKSPQIKPTALINKGFKFRTNNDLTDKNYVFDESDIKHSDNIAEEAITDCIQYFHRFN